MILRGFTGILLVVARVFALNFTKYTEPEQFPTVLPEFGDDAEVQMFHAEFMMARWYEGTDGRNWNTYHSGLVFVLNDVHFLGVDFSPKFPGSVRNSLIPDYVNIKRNLLLSPITGHLGEEVWKNMGKIRVWVGDHWPLKPNVTYPPEVRFPPANEQTLPKKFGWENVTYLTTISGQAFRDWYQWATTTWREAHPTFSIPVIMDENGLMTASSTCHDFITESATYLHANFQVDFEAAKTKKLLRDYVPIEALNYENVGPYTGLGWSHKREIHRMARMYLWHQKKLLYGFASLHQLAFRMRMLKMPMYFNLRGDWYRINLRPGEGLAGIFNYCYLELPFPPDVATFNTTEKFCVMPWTNGRYPEVSSEFTRHGMNDLPRLSLVEFLIALEAFVDQPPILGGLACLLVAYLMISKWKSSRKLKTT